MLVLSRYHIEYNARYQDRRYDTWVLSLTEYYLETTTPQEVCPAVPKNGLPKHDTKLSCHTIHISGCTCKPICHTAENIESDPKMKAWGRSRDAQKHLGSRQGLS